VHCSYCGFQTGEDMSPRIEHSVKLVHWALMDKEISCDLDTDVYNYGCWGRNSPEVNVLLANPTSPSAT